MLFCYFFEKKMFFCTTHKKFDLEQLLSHYHLQINWLTKNAKISGSWFGEPEAGIIQNQLYVRPDTPIHSALHESCHYICMDSLRRQQLNTNAAGDYDEENAVCYLQILLVNYLPFMSQQQMMNDMDDWGYTFRLGSAQRWFYEDAKEAQAWLYHYHLIDQKNHPTWQLRQ
jgi:hypothetical protein